MLCFLDNDVILKLVACSLFAEAISSLGVTNNELRVLDTAKPVFRNSSKVKRKYLSEILNTAIEIVQQCQSVYPENSAVFKTLQQFDGIDLGEATLISAMLQENAFWFVTGDKRCLSVIANEPQLVEIREKLKGRVVCLEYLILKVLSVHGFGFVQEKVLPAIEYDTTLKSCFGSGMQATRENVVLSLEGYISDLKRNSGDLLVDW